MAPPERRRRRMSKTVAVVIVLVTLVTLGGGSAVAYEQLKTRADRLQVALTADIQAGQQELEAGKASLTQANSKHDTALLAQAVAHFNAAKARFQSAGQTADASKLLRYLEMVPAAGNLVHARHTAVDGIAEMGVALADAGNDIADLDTRLLKPASGQTNRNLLTVLDEAQSTMVKVKKDLDRADHAAALVDSSVLPAGQQATFAKARATIGSALAGIDEFQQLAPGLRDILGANGERNYLIEQVNPSELRAGGGFIGTYSLLRANGGTLTLLRSGNAYDVAGPRPNPGDPNFVPEPSPYREVIPQISWSFVDSNLYPDFASNATAAEKLTEPFVGMKLSGVIAMDYYTVAKMLELTGPITIADYGTVDSSNFIPQAIKHELALDPTHKTVLSTIAGQLMQRISTLAADKWPAMISAFTDLAAGRHLQAYFNDAAIERNIDRIGWSGRVNPTGATDYMMEVEDNYFGNKINYFLTRHFSVTLTRTDNNKLHHKIVVDLINAEPAGTEDRETYKADLRMFFGPFGSKASDNLRAVIYPDPAPPDGTSMINGWIDVGCCGGKGQAVFEYDTPWSTLDDGTHEVYWQKQPGTANDKVAITWNDGSGHSSSATGELNGDRLIILSGDQVRVVTGKPALTSLPSLNFG